MSAKKSNKRTMESGTSSGSEEKEKKPITPTNFISLIITGQDNSGLSFRVKRSVRLQSLFNAFAVHKSLDLKFFRFLYDGKRILGDQTPAELGLEDGDEIQAFLEQISGGYGCSGLQ